MLDQLMSYIIATASGYATYELLSHLHATMKPVFLMLGTIN